MVVAEIGSIKVLYYTYFRLLIAVEKMDGLYLDTYPRMASL